MTNTSTKSRAQALLNTGSLAEAKVLYTQMCEADPDDMEAWHKLGGINGMLGLFEEAEACARKVITLHPEIVAAYNNLGAALLAQDKNDLAKAEFNIALGLDPRNHETLNNLGNLEMLAENFSVAGQYYRKAIDLKQDYADAHGNLASVLLHTHKPQDAMEHLNIALEYNPEHPDYLYHHAKALHSLKRYAEAMTAYAKVLKIQPGMKNALTGIAELYEERGDFTLSERFYRRLLEITPDNARAMGAIACIKKEKGEINDAVACYQKAIDMNPGISAMYSNYFLTLNYSDEHKDIATEGLYKAWERTLKDTVSRTFKFDDRYETRKLTIGYVSHDFRKHSVTYFFEPLIKYRNKIDFRIICYSNMGHHQADDTTRVIAAEVDLWQDITYMPDHETAAMIHADKVDILVDLSGHTAGHRLGVFALRPAPVQVTYLGYPNTTGLSAMDYRITDPVADPLNENTSGFAEKLLRLPHCFLTYQPPLESPAVRKPPCHENKHVTFGSFNALPKITDEVLDCWCSLLENVDESRIILKCSSFRDTSAKERVLNYFTSRNIPTDRISLYSQLAAYSEHMELYSQIDIALDTFPYNGTTTTCEALWMGVPVITLAGKSHAGRVSSSLLHEIKIDELIASSTEEYIKIAADLAKDKHRITDYRHGMRKMMSASILGNHKTFTNNLEEIYRGIWNRYIDA